jgi:hypothetical protein
MMASPRRRADGRGTTRPRTLACTADGVWLWPGTPLTQRRGTALVPLRTPQLYELVAAFHGAGVHAPSLARTVQSAAACLNLGRAREAAQIVAALDLPPVSFEGAALMRAIGRRLGVAGPEVEVAGHPRALEQELIERLASVHDGKRTVAQALECVFTPDLFRVAPSTALFDPALHPRWPAGRPDGGQFRPRDGEGAVVPVQWQGPALRVAARLLARLLGLLRRVPKLPKPGEAPPPGEPVPKPDTSTPAQQKPPGIGHNGPPADEATAPEAGSRGDAAPEPPLDESEPFELPAERPTGKGAVARWGRRVADEIHDAIERGDADRLAEIADALSRADWIKDQLDNIVAAQDPPRSLDDLIDAAQDKRSASRL